VRAGLGLTIVPEAAAGLNFSGVQLRPLRLRAPAPVELFLVCVAMTRTRCCRR
jgi:DNA-binding transcriptional LysR family regulator